MVSYGGKVYIHDIAVVKDLFPDRPNRPSARKARDYLGRYNRKKFKMSPVFLAAFGITSPDFPESTFHGGKRKRIYYQQLKQSK